MLLKDVKYKVGKHTPNIIRSTIHIKNMVSKICIKLIKQELEKTGLIRIVTIKLAEAEIEYDDHIINFDGINFIFKQNGFELITDNVSILIEQIKVTIIQCIFFGNKEDMKLGNFYYLSKKLGYSYSYLSRVFSQRMGITLERYIILVKVERVKELISYNELTLVEIAYQVGYCNTQYLSNLFRDITGYTISTYRDFLKDERKPLTSILA